MKHAILTTTILGLAMSGAAHAAGPSETPQTLKVRLHLSSLRCETAADGASVTLLGGQGGLMAIGGSKFQYDHPLAWAVGCDPVAVEALKKKAAQFFMFAPADATVEHSDVLASTEEPGKCVNNHSERVTIAFTWDSGVTLSSTVTESTGVVDCQK